jgi:transaldolase
MSAPKTAQLHSLGQSLWYDNISKQLIDSGELKKLISDYGVRGLTSNPTIFDNAISKTSSYDALIKASAGSSVDKIFEEIAVSDVGAAADLLRPVYESSKTEDGYASIEVSPTLAADTEGSISEGIKLFDRLDRPNIMIKVPGTKEGLPAIKALLEKGINVNITLLFSVENYTAVANTYIEALKTRLKNGQDVKNVRSVASFFVSRVDTLIDKKLGEIAAKGGAQADEAKALMGKFGVANSKIAYKKFQDLFYGEGFKELKAAGAFVQRPLWASTGVKNPAYKDTLYVEELIGSDTVNTMPHDTVMAFADHGIAAEAVTKGLDEALKIEPRLKAVGVDVAACLRELQEDGVKKFVESFVSLNSTIQKKMV